MSILSIFLIIIDIFRMPLLAIGQLQAYGFFFHIVFFIVPFLLCKKITIHKINIGFFEIWAIVSLVSSFLFFINGLPLEIFLSQVLPIISPPFLIFLYKILKIEDSLHEVINKALYYSFYLGCLYFICEWLFIYKLNILPYCSFATWFFGYNNEHYCSASRRMLIGFLIFKDIGLAYVMGCFFSLKKDTLKKQLINFILMFSVLVMTDSITLIGIFFLFLIITYLKYIKRHFQVAVFIFLLLFSMFFNTLTYSRVLSYLILELNLNKYFPTFLSCKNFLFSLDGISSSCNSNEVHSLFYFFKFGIIPTIGWYLTFFMSLYYFIKGLVKKNLNQLLFFNLVFVFNAIHYSGAESWGINFIFVIILYLVSFQEKQNCS